MISEMIYQIKRALFIHIPVLNQLGLEEPNYSLVLMKFFQDMFGMMTIRF